MAQNDRYFDGVMRLCDDALLPQYRRLTDLIHRQSCPVIAQLALGAFFREQHGFSVQTEPDEMTAGEIALVSRQFVEAAVRAEKAGFDGVQIHAAHFFFLSRFISPAVNHRTDSYGGSTENRVRIVIEILKGIREAAPGLHITVKINSSDFTRGGLTEQESLELCKLLNQAGIDSIEVSGNGTSVGGIRAHVNEGYFVPAAAQLAAPEKADAFVTALRHATVLDCRPTTHLGEILTVAQKTGIDKTAFVQAYENGSAEAALQDDLNLTHSLGIRSLPTYLIQYQEKAVLLQSFAFRDFAAAITKLIREQHP